MRYYLAATILIWFENQTWPPHFAGEGTGAIAFFLGFPVDATG